MTKRPTKKNTPETKTAMPTTEDKLLMMNIPEVNLRLVYEWIESDQMTMPHSQVVTCLKLLATATVVKG